MSEQRKVGDTVWFIAGGYPEAGIVAEVRDNPYPYLVRSEINKEMYELDDTEAMNSEADVWRSIRDYADLHIRQLEGRDE